MHVERDIVLPILSVRLSVCPSPSDAGTVCKTMDITSQIFVGLFGESFYFTEPYRRYKIPREIPSAGGGR